MAEVAKNTGLRISASRLKCLSDCSWAFYCQEILKIPEKTHPKTLVGTICHSILECLARERHRKQLDIICREGSIYASPVMRRFVKISREHYGLEDESLIDPIDDMAMVALKHDFYATEVREVLEPEFEFNIQLSSGSTVKGYMDRVLIYADHAVIRDYKTQGQKFPAKELHDNFQAATYQWAIKRTMGLPSYVEFIMLRHGPTQRFPRKHLQIVDSMSDAQLAGFEAFLNRMAEKMGDFDESNACENFRAVKDSGFCNRVCQFKEPKDYFALLDENGKILKTSLNDDLKAENGGKIEKRHYNGCKYFYNP